jgi:hypothetical protein
MLGGAAAITGFEADTGLPVDWPPSFRQGFGRVFLGAAAAGVHGMAGWPAWLAWHGWLGCHGYVETAHAFVLDFLHTIAARPDNEARGVVLAAICAAGNSVYLANQADSPQLAVVDAVTINQGMSGWVAGVLSSRCTASLA